MHYLSVFHIPATIVNKLDSLIATFFWKDRHGKGIHWKNRDVLHSPCNIGGLGIRNIGLLNNALLMKKAWRIRHNPQLLLSKVYHISHSMHQPHLLTQRQLSWGHRGLLLADTLLNTHCKWKVGNGCTVGVTTHNWLPGSAPIFRDDIPLVVARRLTVGQLILPAHQG